MGNLTRLNWVNVPLSLLPSVGTVQTAKSDSDVMFCLLSYQGLIIDRSIY